MKKSTLIPAIISIFIFLFFISCKKESPSTGSGTATTIKGTAKAELNLTVTGYENIPDGTKITFLIDPNDLLNKPDTAKKLDSYRYTATVSSGQYSINLPARNNGSKVKIVADQFEYQKVLDNNGNTIRVVYSTPVDSTTIYAGTTKFHDVYY